MQQRRRAGPRVVIIALAVIELLYWLPFLPGLAREQWSYYSAPALVLALFLVVVCPILAAAVLILAIRNQRLGLAGILVSVEPVAFVLSVLAFGIGGIVYGF